MPATPKTSGEPPPPPMRYKFRTSDSTNKAIRALKTRVQEVKPPRTGRLSTDQLLAAAFRIAKRDRAGMRHAIQAATERDDPGKLPYQSFRTTPGTNWLIDAAVFAARKQLVGGGEFGKPLSHQLPADHVIAAALTVAGSVPIQQLLDEIYPPA